MMNLKTAHFVNRFITRSLYSMHNRKTCKVRHTSLSSRPYALSLKPLDEFRWNLIQTSCHAMIHNCVSRSQQQRGGHKKMWSVDATSATTDMQQSQRADW